MVTQERVAEEPTAQVKVDVDSKAYRKAADAARGRGAEIIEQLADKLGAKAGAQAAFGTPIERDGRIVVPVAQSAWGLGGGSGDSQEQGSGTGAGGGTMTRPVGYLDITADQATFVPLGKPWQDARLILAWAAAIWLVSRAVNRILRG